MPGAADDPGGAVLSPLLCTAIDETGFPFGSGERHLQSIPLLRALGLRWVGLVKGSDGDGPIARQWLPCNSAVCTAAGAIDLRALTAVLDQAGAPACYGAQVSAGYTATMSLHVDFCGLPLPGLDVHVHSRCVATDGATALVLGDARHEGGPVLARMSGRYVVGVGPGRAGGSADPPGLRAEQAARHGAFDMPDFHSFDTLLGLHADVAADADGLAMGFEPWLVGSVALPALHGGALAAGLMSTADGAAPSGLKLTSLTIQFLRAGHAQATQFCARVVKAGPRAAYLAADASQQRGQRHLAVMQALYA